MGFPGDSVVRNLPASAGDVQKIRVPSLVQEDPLEKEMATHSSILAWEIPWTEEHGGVQSSSVQSLSRVRLFVTPLTAAHQASLSLAISRSLPKFMSIASLMPSSHLIL